MSALTASQVLALAIDAGFTRAHADVMTTVAWYESEWNPDNIGDASLSHFGSVGLWQIFTGAHSPQELKIADTTAWTTTNVNTLKDPGVNARAAHIVFQEQGYEAWSTYNNFHATAGFEALVTRIAAITLSAPAPGPVAPPAPVPTVTLTLEETTPGVWVVKA